jgi:UDP-N-acetylmuramyl tripeptide synthase
MLLRMAPDAIAVLGKRLTRGATVISATNGKTTTAGMLAGALRAAGRDPVHNRAGSNMTWGVATALAEQHGEEGLFEVDEAWVPHVIEALDPRLLVLGNLFRDQLDRYGELEKLADTWAEVVAAREGNTRFVLNADDPLVADLGRDSELRRREGVAFFGIEDPRHALPELQHAHDAKHCRRCGAPYRYERAFVGHLGHYDCPNCGADRPDPDLSATEIELDGMRGSRVLVRAADQEVELSLPIPGLYNVYNALAALAAAAELGIPLADAAEALGRMQAVFGRVETIEVDERPLSILLIKNPAGANEVLRTLRLEAGTNGAGNVDRDGLDLWLALNDRIADGRDVSWIWDADFELLAGHVRRATCSGTRAEEMALRLKYAGIDTDLVVERDLWRSLESAVASTPEKKGPVPVFALPTYTALLELRDQLADRGLAKPWAA